jgi:hypothetical protein
MIAAVGDMGCTATDPDGDGGDGTAARCAQRYVLRVVVGAFTAPFAARDAAGLRPSGSTLTAYRRTGDGTWTRVGSATDASITAGGYLSFTPGDTTVRGGALGGGTTEGGRG